MEATPSTDKRLARAADHVGMRRLAPPARLLVASLGLLGLALAVGALAGDLLVPEPEAILAAPFRWRAH